MLSNACAYGLRAMMHLAQQPRTKFVAIDSIAEAVALPKAFLRKIMHKLVHAGIVESVRGAGGGVRLAQKANAIAVFEVVLAIDGNKRFTGCVLHLEKCNPNAPCPFHHEWAKQRSMIQDELQRLSLQDVAETMRQFYLDDSSILS
jgi:Rrf2 family transcriptional regulator, iron-sulfur cluster assembly transcription factor